MTGFQYTFDATQYTPEQSAGAHPVGKFIATISHTELKPIKDDAQGRPRFVVEFSTDQGKISNGYNLWSENQKAVDISHKQLSALSYAIGVFKLDMQNEGAALRGARCMIEVGKQKEGEYVEVKKVFDVNGNEPGKPVQAQQQPSQGFAPSAPVQQQPAPAQAPAWGAQPQTAPAAQWAAPQAAPVQQQPAFQQAPATAAPPWAK